MKASIKSLAVLLMIGLFFSCSDNDKILTEEIPEVLRSTKELVKPSTSTDVSVKAEEDWNKINNALQNAASGQTVQLGKGLFYLHKSIVVWDFNGSLKGSGRGQTIIQTAPGITFDRSASPILEWSFELNEGHFMISFPHHANTEERTVSVSNLTLVISEPCDTYHIHTRSDNLEQNTLQGINTHYENLVGTDTFWGDLTLSDKIHLNVYYKNIAVIGEQDPKYLGSGFSVKAGLTAFGASMGVFEAKNITIENAQSGMLLHAFCGENSMITVKNVKVSGAVDGIYSFLGTSYDMVGNIFTDISGYGMQFFGNNPFVTFDMPLDAGSFIANNHLMMIGSGPAIMGDRSNNVNVCNNTLTGNSFTGIQVNFGFEPDNCSNWIIKNNDMCDLTVSHSAGATIVLNKIQDSEVKNNANQVVGGSSADNPSNLIWNAKECD